MSEECWLCKNSEQLIKKFNLWKIIINENQYYLGRIVLGLNRHEEDFLNISPNEKEKMFVLLQKIANMLKRCFNPDKLNYAVLMNQDKHVHMHIIPRYKKKRVLESFTFVDENFGHNPFQQNIHSFKLEKRIFNKIIEQLKNALY